MDRAIEAAKLIAPTALWRRTLATAILHGTDAVFVGVHTCPPGERRAATACFAPPELEERARALAARILPRLERRFPSERWAEFNGKAFSLFDHIGCPRFVKDILREQRALGIEGVITAFFQDQDGATIGGITVATREPGCDALAAHGDALSEVAATASQTLRSAIDLAVRCGAVAVSPRSKPSEALSEREREIVQLVCLGFSDLNIAQRLGISENTVGAHLRRIFRKLSVHRRLDLALLMSSGAVPGARACRKEPSGCR